MKNINYGDLQWPSHQFTSCASETSSSKALTKIEEYFSSKFSLHVNLLPSGRSALGTIFDYKNFNRGDVTFIPRWSSHCLYNTIGAYSSITENFSRDPSICLAVHKWGRTMKVSSSYKNYVIEDSSDSIHLNKKSFFPNRNSEFEIISLPKVIGSVSGGLVVHNNSDFSAYVKSIRGVNLKLSEYQSKLKWNGHAFKYWGSLEYNNRDLTLLDLNNILKNLDNYELNKKIILKRLESFKNISSSVIFKTNRLGPVIALKKNEYKVKKPFKISLNRMFDFTLNIENPNYDPALIIPIHLGINENDFKNALENLFLVKS